MVERSDGHIDDDSVLPLNELVRRAIDGGRSVDGIAQAAGRDRKGIYPMLKGKTSAFPKPESVKPLADALGVSTTTLLLAYAKSLGIPVSVAAPTLAALLPPGVETLGAKQVDAILSVVRAMIDPAEDSGGTAEIRQLPPPRDPEPVSKPVKAAARTRRDTTERRQGGTTRKRDPGGSP